MLSEVDAVNICVVLEDAVDMLAILGAVMPVSFVHEEPAGAVTTRQDMVNDAVGTLMSDAKMLEVNYRQLRKLTEAAIHGEKHQEGRDPKLAQLEELIEGIRKNHQVFSRSLNDNPLAAANLRKLQTDRAFLEKTLTDTMKEILDRRTFRTLTNAVITEKEDKAKLMAAIEQEEDSRRKIKELQMEITEVKQKQDQAIQDRSEVIAYLKDQLQELKVKTTIEGKYYKARSELQVSEAKKKMVGREEDQRTEMEELTVKIDEETRVNAELDMFLRSYQQELDNKVEYWMNKYDTDTDGKESELKDLKVSRDNDAIRFNDIAKKYADYTTAIEEEKMQKENELKRKEELKVQLRAAVRIQAWWRGIMVRRQLGPYSKKKKKKKKGKGKGKGKGKSRGRKPQKK